MQLETEINTLSIGTILLLSADAHHRKMYHHMALAGMGEHLRRSETFSFYFASKAMLNNNSIALFQIFFIYNVSLKQL